MRSLAAQLVALALAVPVSTVSSSHPASTQPASAQLSSRTTLEPQRARCTAYCEARMLRHALRRVHGRTVALARRAALPVPPPPRLGWRRTSLRVQLAHQARVLGSYRAQARRPLRLRLERFEAWVCIHRHEAAWDDSGDPYWGGLQMDRGFMRAYGGDMIRRHRGGLADTWTPAEQIVVAERAYASRGFAPWPQTARSCGVR
jgi:Transglycosylase-like domain